MTDQTTTNTEGSAYNEGEVNTDDGDFVGRDQINNSTGPVLSGDFRGAIINLGSSVSGSTQQIGGAAPPGPGESSPQPLTLPFDHPPKPGLLPHRSRMPLNRNPLFTGREDDLRSLARTLEKREAVVVITGLGGMGKTQLASEFVYRYGQYFSGGVFWLSFADHAAIPIEVAICGGVGVLDLQPNFSGLPLEDQVRLVFSAWQSPLPRLLIFDNCEDELLLSQWRPLMGGCRVLLTSRRGKWSKILDVTTLPLNVLRQVESVTLLRRHRPDLSADGTLEDIATELGNLPLALHIAGSYLETFRDDPELGNPSNFLAELQDTHLFQHPALQGIDVTPSPTNHELHVGRTFALSYDHLKPTDPLDNLAMTLLARAAPFAPGEPIPRELLLQTIDLSDRDARRQAVRAINRLVELGLVNTGEDGSLVLHQLLARFAQEVGEDDTKAQTDVEQALIEVASDLNKKGYSAPLLAILSHLRYVTEIALPRADNMSANLASSLGNLLTFISDYINARPYVEQALTIREKVLGSNHPDTASSLSDLAFLFFTDGSYETAVLHSRRALSILEANFGSNDPKTAAGINSLAFLVQATGDYRNAQLLNERALAIREVTFGPNHPKTAQSLSNLAAVLRVQGDVSTAKMYCERALAIDEATFAPDHPAVARSLDNLGQTLFKQGDYALAKTYFDRALAIQEKSLGIKHSSVARSLDRIAWTLIRQDDYSAARPYFDRALAIREEIFGTEHSETAKTLGNIGFLLHEMGDSAAASSYYKRALAIFEKTFGPAHPDTLNMRDKLESLKPSS